MGDDLTLRLLEQGLKAASLRQQVIAHNVANVNTPGFKRSRVDFEAKLAAAIAAGEDPKAITPEVVQEHDSVGRPDGNNVDIEAEMAHMAENQLWYSALTRQISDHFGRLRMVIRDGR